MVKLKRILFFHSLSTGRDQPFTEGELVRLLKENGFVNESGLLSNLRTKLLLFRARHMNITPSGNDYATLLGNRGWTKLERKDGIYQYKRYSSY